MQNRAETIQATLSISPRQPKGTIVTCSVQSEH
jgi:nitrate/nitrite-specific signal transduction histidine kinase